MALTWLVGTIFPLSSSHLVGHHLRPAHLCTHCTCIRSSSSPPRLPACSRAWPGWLRGALWLSNHPGLAFLEDGWGGRPGARPLAMLWFFPRYLGWLVLEPGSGVRPLAEVGGHLLKRGSLRRSGEENRARARVRGARCAASTYRQQNQDLVGPVT